MLPFPLVLLFIFTHIGRSETRQRCDLIELNHKVDETGSPVFTQIIIWNWKPEVCHHHVDAWWLADESKTHLLPRKTPDGWVVHRIDGQCKITSVVAKSYRETTTVNDPETDDKKRWHESRRRWH